MSGLRPPVCTFGLALVLLPATLVSQVRQVAEIRPGPEGIGVFEAAVLGSTLYFTADDGDHGSELWASNGTAEGTHLVVDVWPDTVPDIAGLYSSAPTELVVVGEHLYFAASGGEDPVTHVDHRNLWRTNGQPGNAADLGLRQSMLTPRPRPVAMGGSLYVSGWTSLHGWEPWKVTGTSSIRLLDIETGEAGSSPDDFAVIPFDLYGDRLLFSADTTAAGREPWISDGDGLGTALLQDLNPIGSGDSWAGFFTAFRGRAFFHANDGVNGYELWVTDGSEAGTEIFVDLDASSAASPLRMAVVGDRMFFSAHHPDYGSELWVTDGLDPSSTGTYLVLDMTSGPASSGLVQFRALHDRLYFLVWNDEGPGALWVSDGTPGGTHQLLEIMAPDQLTVADGLLFFTGLGSQGYELWASDGTIAGTDLVADLRRGSPSSAPWGLTEAPGQLYFVADAGTGAELHVLPTVDVVTEPEAPDGPAEGSTETEYTYTTGGAISLRGRDVEYRFDWGDGTDSGWLPVGVTEATKAWANSGFLVTVEARSDLASSARSAGLSIWGMVNTEQVTPSVVSGTSDGIPADTYEFGFTGSSTSGHAVDYRVNWGDGTWVDWTAFPAGNSVTLAHAWDSAGEYTVTITVRCSTHQLESASATHVVTIAEEAVAAPQVAGVPSGWVGSSYGYRIEASSNSSHPLQYSVYFGDGLGEIDWTLFPQGSRTVQLFHTFVDAGEYSLDVGVRCSLHPEIGVWRSSLVTMEFAPADLIFDDGFESGDTSRW